MRSGIFVTLALAAVCAASTAEAKPKVHDYRFADGVTVSDPGHYQLNLSGYVQPWLEGVMFLGSGPDGFNQRFRLRRLRLRLVGDAPRQRLSFRFQLDLFGSAESGTTELRAEAQRRPAGANEFAPRTRGRAKVHRCWRPER